MRIKPRKQKCFLEGFLKSGGRFVCVWGGGVRGGREHNPGRGAAVSSYISLQKVC